MGELANVLQSFPFLSVMNWDKLNLLKLRRLKEPTGEGRALDREIRS